MRGVDRAFYESRNERHHKGPSESFGQQPVDNKKQLQFTISLRPPILLKILQNRHRRLHAQVEGTCKGQPDRRENFEEADDLDLMTRHQRDLRITDVFEPAELTEKMMTAEDERIRVYDLPERFQTRANTRSLRADNEQDMNELDGKYFVFSPLSIPAQPFYFSPLVAFLQTDVRAEDTHKDKWRTNSTTAGDGEARYPTVTGDDASMAAPRPFTLPEIANMKSFSPLPDTFRFEEAGPSFTARPP
ncbi:hypothetical protein HDV00_008348 [Rhizophlyctis rosea]|nr:hypothetical protein HDV00_008348 [Rhizophlyctis rosea]